MRMGDSRHGGRRGKALLRHALYSAERGIYIFPLCGGRFQDRLLAQIGRSMYDFRAKSFTTGYESACIRGRAEEVTDTEEKIEALRLLCVRHTPANMANFDAAVKGSLARTAIWRVKVYEITGKRKVLRSE